MRAAITSTGDARGDLQANSLRRAANAVWPSLPVTVLIYFIFVLIPAGVSIGPLFLTPLRLFLLMIALPAAMKVLRQGIIPTDILFVFHFLWIIPALLTNNSGMMVTQLGSAGMEFIGGYLVGRAYVRDREDMRALFRALIVAVLCLTPLAVFEAFSGRTIILEFFRAIPGLNAPNPIEGSVRFGLRRAQVLFHHSIHWGLYCSLSLSFCFIALKGRIGDLPRWLASGAIVIGGFMSVSSGAVLAIVMQIGLIFWNWLFRNSRKRWWILVGLSVVAYVTIDLLSSRTPMRVFMTYATFSAHTAYWRSLILTHGMENVWANPIFGIGFNDWVRPYWMGTSSVDNFWLLTAMRFGIPGFLFVAIGYGLGIMRVIFRRLDEDPVLDRIRYAWVITCISLTFTLATVHVWANIYSFVFFLFGAGMWLGRAEPAGSETDNGSADTIMSTSQGPVFTRFPRRAAASEERPAAD